ncbi:photosynthetic reaction center cytochrome PufC [Methylobacterium isbiliense]|jgi:photosynthetic reaction center cytochrome c subunit|uniref:Photosynthetic reaction center cytochrome c subunit n=1 Tax=Methylobacterium isbiliense TaxID=315478 RepID=A0ABQ4SEE5_9HYPH|nr:photosynthetic reaction center cytochrome PufC [Methylobacterium isbiliense]MDN3623274.1 photosynthetic reaction center cytochrome PufC [Methylobacterium isbiliense]GJE00170.1 Photosynthetic reaction center cytochrome c subunit [Methylobacterium isbiliense]
MRIALQLLGVVLAVLLTGAMLGTAGWVLPPVQSEQVGFRGTGMVQVHSPKAQAALLARNEAPAPQDPAPPGGEPATKTYQNVQVLTDLSTDQFNRIMASITEWVSPEQGCAYCHNVENMADDSVYAKTVARTMFRMVRAINGPWKNHVGETGVTCYTCHRGQPVPANVWHINPGPAHPGGFAARDAGQNHPSLQAGLSSMNYDPYRELLGDKAVGERAVRVAATTALPETRGESLQHTERTYALMIHMSEGLGVNCTYCHNTRAFSSWSESTPKRVTAWHGIRMVRDINGTYIDPTAAVLPPERLGPEGDPAKVNCTTCHQGLAKPLNGAPMLKDYPELAGPVAAKP